MVPLGPLATVLLLMLTLTVLNGNRDQRVGFPGEQRSLMEDRDKQSGIAERQPMIFRI